MVMLVENVKLNVSGMEIEVSKGSTLLEISKMFNTEGRKPIVAKVFATLKQFVDLYFLQIDHLNFLHRSSGFP